MEKKMNYKDLGAGIFFLLFSIIIYTQSLKINVTVGDIMGPRFFPQLVSIIMGILSFILIVASFKSEEKSGKIFENKLSMIMTLIILLMYAILLEIVGFVILTIFYLFIQILLLLPKEYLRNKKYLVITGFVAIITPIFLYLLFYNVFSIFLPAGILG
ncbi:MAG: tripartite tricarboxylate transporter TctB family protein [Fusobacterium varium]|uniref:tripartite tricarboxylate transporter TctB family protein n=1 Tax=Fusobacterium varium TaxID=856 RepID=UPI00242A7CA9|nr:tripartite tricarboxylate transporter TctB family protein [Fusobacterium varium]UYI78939.1 MAG: tripartite tricarboxylate transporter TctB family protein [Fusobacterium varium]